MACVSPALMARLWTDFSCQKFVGTISRLLAFQWVQKKILRSSQSDLDNTGQWNSLTEFLTSGSNLISVHLIFLESNPQLNKLQYSQYLLSTSRQFLCSALFKLASKKEFWPNICNLIIFLFNVYTLYNLILPKVYCNSIMQGESHQRKHRSGNEKCKVNSIFTVFRFAHFHLKLQKSII